MFIFRRFEFSTTWFLSTILCICGLGAYVNLLQPQSTISIIGLICIIAGITFSLCMFLTNSIKRAVLYAIGSNVFLVLRFLGLREWYFPLLLLITVLSTDAYLVRINKADRV